MRSAAFTPELWQDPGWPANAQGALEQITQNFVQNAVAQGISRLRHEMDEHEERFTEIRNTFEIVEKKAATIENDIKSPQVGHCLEQQTVDEAIVKLMEQIT